MHEQILDLGRHFLCHTFNLRQLERGLHHLSPLVGCVNALGANLGMPPVSERTFLLLMWITLEVCVDTQLVD